MKTTDLPSNIIISQHNNNRPKTFGIVINHWQSFDRALLNGWNDCLGTIRVHSKNELFIELVHICGIPWYVYPILNKE